MANLQNLKPFNAMPEDLRRELAKRGGKASGAARRAKRERIEKEKAAAIAKRENDILEMKLMLQAASELACAARIYRSK